MLKPVDVDVYLIKAKRGTFGEVAIAVAVGRVPSETHPKIASFVIPPKEFEEKKDKLKGKIKTISIDSEDFKKLKPEVRRLAREALRSPSSYIPEELLEGLE
ncbi:hypothetical protein EYM_07720 [Ignicoccus islandicus DSM 13165]|uniref:Uncharacterized protein n=1 Tax=Ignicoccus islandicus DSM 13165 TaxID=940295 RepID=A0A0U3E4G1_9CREN|nr:hypothetical protein [Ignicoccus islandicus]ALU12811.1 hypothetical protein EYM_07720 [Ignicoccus islandicus DSM 13165]